MRSKIFISAIAWSLMATAMATTALAQAPTGTISGHVSDQSGGVMPGVTVTAGSPNLQGMRSAVTTENGDYLIPLLPPGEYSVTFELSGFQTVRRMIGVAGTQTVSLDITMAISPLAETVSVVGNATPFVETTQVATSFKQDLLATLPSNRSLDATLLMAPAVSPTGPAGNYSINGAPSFEGLFMLDGVAITENLRGQPYRLYIEDALQETTVATAGISAEYGRFTGGVVNAVTKSGGNMFSGSYRLSINNDDWRSISPFHESKLDKIVPTHEYTFGGPIVRDRLWFFNAGRFQNQEASRSTAVTNVPFIRTDDEKRYEVKLTHSFATNHTVAGTFTKIDQLIGNNVFQNAMDLRSLFNQGQPQDLVSLHYTGVIRSNLFVEGQYSQRNFSFVGAGATSTDLIDGTLLIDRSKGGTSFRYWSATFCGVCDNEDRDNQNVVVKGTYFLSTRDGGSHNVAFGYDGYNDHRFANNHQSGSDYRILGTSTVIRDGVIYPQFLGNDTTIIQHNPIPQTSQGVDFRTHSLFANDTWRYNGNLTFNLGVRWDKNDGTDAVGARVTKDSKFSPRLGLVWDPLGDGRWAVNGSFARYVSSVNSGVGDVSAGGNPASFQWFYQGPSINPDPGGPLVSTPDAIRQVFAWFNANGGAARPFIGVSLPGVDQAINDSLASPNANEVAFGLSRQSGRGAVRADFVWRDFNDFYANRVDTTTGKVRDATGREFDFNLVENTNIVDRKYRGLSLQGNYRVGRRLDVGANYTVSRLWGDFQGETAASGPVTNAALSYPEYRERRWNYPEGYLDGDQRHRSRLWGTYQVPVADRFGTVSVGVLQQIGSGVAYSASGPIDARPYVNNPGYVTPQGGNSVTYFFSGRGAFRTEATQRTDLALNYAYGVRPGGRRIDLFIHAEVLNLFNQFQLCGCGGTVFGNGGATDLRKVGSGILTRSNSATMQAFNPFTQTPVQGVNWDFNQNFGKQIDQFSYTSPRIFRFNLGARF